MKRYFLYLIFYSLGGWVLERIINLIFLGRWWDNSVLYGPYQPLYGSGIVMAIFIYEFGISKLDINKLYQTILLLFVAIITTGISEAVTGYSYEFFTGNSLWDYTQTFPLSINYLSLIATPLFGILSFLVIKYLHPYFNNFLYKLPDYIVYTLFGVFTLDVVITLFL